MLLTNVKLYFYCEFENRKAALGEPPCHYPNWLSDWTLRTSSAALEADALEDSDDVMLCV